MAELDLFQDQPRTRRDYDARARSRTPENVRIAKRFGQEFFDGPRDQGYGGYRYDGRWRPFASRLLAHYKLADDARILDVGCAKGFLLHDLKALMPACHVAGVDVSEYAIEHAMADVKPFLRIASADKLPFPDRSFDLVVSINSIHNLPLPGVKAALREIQRVSRGASYITVDAWRNDLERENLLKWILTAETYMHVDDWHRLFDEVGYTGDHWWFIAD